MMCALTGYRTPAALGSYGEPSDTGDLDTEQVRIIDALGAEITLLEQLRVRFTSYEENMRGLDLRDAWCAVRDLELDLRGVINGIPEMLAERALNDADGYDEREGDE